MCDINYLMSSEGLTDLVTSIFFQIDLKTFSQLELISKSWQSYFIDYQLWRRKLLQLAPCGTYLHDVIDKTISKDSDLDVLHMECRRLCWQICQGLPQEWVEKDGIKCLVLEKTSWMLNFAASERFLVFGSGKKVEVLDRRNLRFK